MVQLEDTNIVITPCFTNMAAKKPHLIQFFVLDQMYSLLKLVEVVKTDVLGVLTPFFGVLTPNTKATLGKETHILLAELFITSSLQN